MPRTWNRRFAALACLQGAWALVLVTLAAAAETPSRAKGNDRFSSLDWGDPVVLVMVDGSRLTGTFLQPTGEVASSDYPGRYESWRAASPGSAWLPRLGETVHLVGSRGDTLTGAFRGVAPGFLMVQPVDRPLPRVASLGRFERMVLDTSTGSPGDSSAGWNAWTTAPTLAVVAIATGTDTLAIPAAWIARAAPGRTYHGGQVVAAATGVAAGTIILIALVPLLVIWMLKSAAKNKN